MAGPSQTGCSSGYYAIRPFMPRELQIWLRRRFSSVQARTRFPRWPVETALHDLYDVLLARLAAIAGRPVPWIAQWPEPYRWAIVLSHDVEHRLGYDHLHLLGDVELELGYASSWNFVPERDYTVEPERLDRLRADGFEVGLHGLHHDGRDLESRKTLERRLPAMRAYAERWGAVGFRSPATHRDWELMPLLGVEYDSSSPDTDPFEPKSVAVARGCRSSTATSWSYRSPWRRITLCSSFSSDATMLSGAEGRPPSRSWRDGASPHTPGLHDQPGSGRSLPRVPDSLRRGSDRVESEALRRRFVVAETLGSRVVPADAGWKIVGPAAEDGRIEFVVPQSD